MAVAVQQREAQRERRARHVAAAHVQQPGDRIGRGDQRHVGALGLDDAGDARALGFAALAGELVGMRQHRRQRRRRPVGPHRVDGIGIDRHEFAAGALAGARKALVAVDCLQPGIEAELAALGQVLGDPRFRRLLGDLVRHEGVDVDLGAHGKRIAAVDEDRRAVGQHDGEAGRAAEAGEPGQPLRAARHILALMLVGARHDEAVEAAALELGAQRRQTRCRRRARPSSPSSALASSARHAVSALVSSASALGSISSTHSGPARPSGAAATPRIRASRAEASGWRPRWRRSCRTSSGAELMVGRDPTRGVLERQTEQYLFFRNCEMPIY